ncbi:MAG: metallophosphoesterase [Clostridiales bacterium]|nr:metallophosphoesterase [Clostridiales bacterium]
MRILVVSDTHRETSSLVKIIRAARGGFDMILHLGDCAPDSLAAASAAPGSEVFAVRGNCDGSDPAYRDWLAIPADGHVVFMTHGHRYGVSAGDTTRLYYAALERGADVCLFGHTHFPVIERGGGLLTVNPGSLSRPRGFPAPTYAALTISGDIVDASIIAVYGDGIYRPADI